MSIVIVDDVPALQRIAARELANAAAAAIDVRGRFVLGLPGGSVATTFFPALARTPVDWTRSEIFWIDERAVPPDHPDSNYALASRLLLQPAAVPPSRVHRMKGELADLDEAARLAAAELTKAAGDPPRLDLAFVGVGEDGHIASIFNVGAETSPVAAVLDAPKPPARRLTMTLPALAHARRIIVAGFGPAKAGVISDAMHGPAGHTPVGVLLRQAASALVLVDSPFSH